MNLRAIFSATPGRTRSGLNLLGLVILVVGISSAASIWRDAGAANLPEPSSPDDSRRYTHDMELYYGKTGLLMDKWKRGLEEWTQGKPLATAIAGASLMVASWLFYVAARHRPEPRR